MTHHVLYDDACNFCKVIVDAFLDWDRGRGRIRAVAIQSDAGRELLHAVPAERHLESFHLVRPDGAVVSGGAALTELVGLMPGGGCPAAVLRRLPGPADAGYRWIARNRIALSRPVPARLKRRATRRLREREAHG